jgi:hypothetical protein
VFETVNGSVSEEGLIKVRLVHARNGSIVIPDHVLVRGQGKYWLQPQWVYPSVLHFYASAAETVLHIGVANTRQADLMIEARFGSADFVAALPDRSQIYSCRITSSVGLSPFQSGRWRSRPDGGVDLHLYHHTTAKSKKAIRESHEVWGSAWNFQGTKKLVNCSYAYFTSLQRLSSWQDLQRIGMAHDGRLRLRLDQTPDGFPPDVVVDVYRESTTNRAATISLWVPAEHVAPSHVWKHTTDRVVYEMAQPWIYRVGLVPGRTYKFRGNQAKFLQAALKQFEYLVIGDCTTPEGLIAPYDEENTEETFLVQELAGETLFDFWRTHGNQALWQTDVETQEFE